MSETLTIPFSLWQDIVEDEEDGWTIESRRHVRNSRWEEHSAIVVSRENKFLIREYWRGKWSEPLTEMVAFQYPDDSEPVTLRRVYPVEKTITVIEYLTDDELSD